ncbi:hypothetical protein L210DRAFT_76436 [Boletus edulis BED1]|uniref:Secreted protein n=1 Tax=Boletus edulis BED1 TaxID=1328754 RepID=A0AAD4G6W8_BOLED|nr:hypothetical protein L210DRAFT_76436 [Boletus edulis BED1]
MILPVLFVAKLIMGCTHCQGGRNGLCPCSQTRRDDVCSQNCNWVERVRLPKDSIKSPVFTPFHVSVLLLQGPWSGMVSF